MKRILKDVKLLVSNDIYNVQVIDIQNIECDLIGPKDTPYENGKWRISIYFPDNYPFKSPSIGFKNKIYHPNIDLFSGSICINVLNNNWTPIYTVSHILEIFLPQLLTYPNPNDPINEEAAYYFLNNKKVYIDNVNKYK